jgi:ATPase family associated with various cellular activities (AAA)
MSPDVCPIGAREQAMVEPMTPGASVALKDGDHFVSSVQHLLAELERIDLFIQLQVTRARQAKEFDEEFQGLYISEKEVDDLLARPVGLPRWAAASESLSQQEAQRVLNQLATEIDRRKCASEGLDIRLRLEELARPFELTPFDIDALLICLAPEIGLRYERLYAYLQDDVTRKRPTIDLVLNLLCFSLETKLAARQRFAASSPLTKHRLLRLSEDSSSPTSSLLSKYLKIDERVASYLLDSDELDHLLRPYVKHIEPKTHLEDLVLPDDVKRRLALLTRQQTDTNRGLVWYFQGPYGVGKQTTAEALCHELGMGLLVIEGERLVNQQEGDFSEAVRLAVRETLLQKAALYWRGIDPRWKKANGRSWKSW